MKLHEVLNKGESFILIKKDKSIYIDQDDFNKLCMEDQEALLNSSVNEIISKPNQKIFELAPSLQEIRERFSERNKQKTLAKKRTAKSMLKYIVLLPFLLIIKGLLLWLQLVMMSISFFLSVAGGLISMLANGIALFISLMLIIFLLTSGFQPPVLGFGIGIGIALIFGLIPTFIVNGVFQLSDYLGYLNSMIDIKP